MQLHASGASLQEVRHIGLAQILAENSTGAHNTQQQRTHADHPPTDGHCRQNEEQPGKTILTGQCEGHGLKSPCGGNCAGTGTCSQPEPQGWTLVCNIGTEESQHHANNHIVSQRVKNASATSIEGPPLMSPRKISRHEPVQRPTTTAPFYQTPQ
jgi:hypothetical protein